MSNEIEKVLEIGPSAAGEPAKRTPETPNAASKDHRENAIGSWLQIVGILVGAFGTFAGIILGMDAGIKKGSWAVGVPVIIASILSCLFFFAFAEVINLLAKIAHNTSK